jgi:mRNA interferase RelE/StbE
VKTIAYTAQADRQLAAMSPDVRDRIEAKIERYAHLGEGDVKAMRGSPTLRLRVGAYRVIFTEDLEILDVLDVGHRSHIYQ